MKKKILLSVICLIGLSLLAYAPIKKTVAEVINIYSSQEQSDFVGGGRVEINRYYLGGNTATTTETYLTTSTASSTLTMSISNSKHIELNMYVTASSSASVLNWSYYFSNDDGATKSWYGEDGYTAISDVGVTHGADVVMHSWTPGTTTFKGKNITITPVAAKYMKIEFDPSGANLGLYVEGVTQEENY